MLSNLPDFGLVTVPEAALQGICHAGARGILEQQQMPQHFNF